TTGNNVYAYTKSQGMFSSKVTNTAAQSANGVYNFPHDPKGNPSNYKEAAITNLFYMNNMLHGFLLNYEFTEAAGNFQSINFSKLGKGRDPVMAIAQASDEPDGASFSTPPDGQSPVMSMGIFGFLWGKRDSSFDNTVITHEYAHGLTSRLTGGKDNADCLQSMEAMGLAEGWSDFLAIMSTAKKTHTRATPREIGVYAETKSMRDKPYTTDMSVNPLKYKDILVDTEEHAVGTIWASMLWDMYWNLVDTLGFTEAYTKPDLTKGNTLALQIVINALKLQPCNPTFAQARSAIIEAEENMTGGKYSCQIWAAFAKRGLGPMALLI
ncbi:peptidase M36, partial [Thamnocephalis sphaerospora]